MSHRRFLVVVAVMAAGAAVVGARCVEVAVLEHEAWVQKAQRQQQRVIEVPGPRGTISSADGYVFATSVARVAIQVDTERLASIDLFARAAAPLLDLSVETIFRRLEQGGRYVWIAQQVPPDVGAEVRSLATNAVGVFPDFARIYPLGRVAAPVIGFVGREERTTVGRSGLEHDFDAVLAGEPEQYLAVSDAIQRRVRLERLHHGRAGSDMELTLLARLQARSEAAVQAALQRHQASSASAVVVEVDTGRLLALVSLPSFDPADAGAVPTAHWRLRPVQDAYEPGSTIKPMVAAAALAAGVVRPGERFDCTARGTRVAGHWVRDHADPGVYTLDEVVVHSANTGIIEAAQRIPERQLWRALAAFGFGRRTGIEFPAEAHGILADSSSWSAMSRAGLALGQELTASPLQMAMAYAAIANGGRLLSPVLIDRDSADRPPLQVLDERLAGRLRSMLEHVITEGTGEMARIREYRVAGKTGTAQRAVNGSFDDQHHVAWFAGFLPMPKPRIAVVVAIEDPREKDFWASTVAAPVFAEIAEAAAIILDLEPTVSDELKSPDAVARRDQRLDGGGAA